MGSSKQSHRHCLSCFPREHGDGHWWNLSDGPGNKVTGRNPGAGLPLLCCISIQFSYNSNLTKRLSIGSFIHSFCKHLSNNGPLFWMWSSKKQNQKENRSFPLHSIVPFLRPVQRQRPMCLVPAGPSSSNTACGNICKSSGHSFLICKMEIIIVPAERHFMRIKWTSKDLNDGWYPGNLPQVLAVESKLSFRKVELYISS